MRLTRPSPVAGRAFAHVALVFVSSCGGGGGSAAGGDGGGACHGATCDASSKNDATRADGRKKAGSPDGGGSRSGGPRDAMEVDSPHGGASDARDDAKHDVEVRPRDDGAPAPSFVLGWYEGASCTCDSNSGGPGNIDTFSAWLGSPITFGSDYAAIGSADAGVSSWDNWAFPSWQSAGWQAWRVKHPGYRLVYAPGMGVVEDMAGGAAGNYDMYWAELGQALVTAGYADAIVRIAHEFNGNWYWYQPQGRTADFIGYWQHAVTAMRSAPGQSFQFFWNPNLGVSNENGQPFDCEDAYPGDDYVDYIGPDTYDADWGVYPTSGTIPEATYAAAWQNTLTEDHGLDWFVTFASQHHKPLAVAEWGVWPEGSTYGGGDDPGYIQNMHDWFVQNHVAFANYFDSGSDAIYPGSPYPNALAKFKSAF